MSADPQPVAVPQGVGIRLAAYLIDIVALSVTTAVVIAAGYGRHIPAPRDLITNPPGWLLMTGVVAQLLYFTILEGAFATTLGKKACGLRVVAVADWSKCGWVRAFLRNLLLPVDGYFYLPGVIAIVMTARRQRIGDLLAGTTVVRFVPADVAAAPAATPTPRQVAHVSANAPAAPIATAGEAPGSDHAAEDEPPFLETGWYRSQEGHQVGPCTWDELWDMTVAGALSADDLVWHESYGADRVPAGEVPELAEAFASRPKA
jgi:uncharacterized RDD family membrane protein YckC